VTSVPTFFNCVAVSPAETRPAPTSATRFHILSYRQRPTWRLAYRNFGSYEALVTNQSVEARPGIADVRWYAIRRPGDQPFVFQQGTYAPDDGTHRWMGSVAMDRKSNMAVGFSVSSETVFPGHPLHRKAQGRPGRSVAARRGRAHQRQRLAARAQLPLGRLHAHRQFQAPRLRGVIRGTSG